LKTFSTEPQIETEKAIFEALFQTASSAMALLKGKELIFEKANPHYLKLLNNRDIIGKSFLEAIPEIADTNLSDLMAEVYKTGKAYSGHEVLVKLRKDPKGPLYDWYFDFTYSRVDTAPGVPYGIYIHATDVTEKVHTRRLIEESERRLQLALQSGQMGTWHLDLQKNAITVSAETSRIIGATLHQEDLGEAIAKVIHPDDKDKLEHALADAVKNGTPLHVEYRIINQGEVRWILAQGNKVSSPEGEIIAYAGIIQDITEDKFVQDQIKVSKLRYELASRATRNAIWDWNLVTNQIAWTEAIYTEYGFKRSEDVEDAKWWYDHIHPADRERVVQNIHQVIDSKEGERWTDEYRFQLADGTYADIWDRGFIVRNAQGKAERMIGAMEDISKRKSVESELAYQSNLTKTITDNAASCLFMMDKKGHPTFMNPAAKKLTGYDSLEEIKDRPLHYAVHWKKPDGTYYPMEDCPIDNAQAELKHVQNQEEIFCKKDGTIFPVSYSVTPLEKDGEVIGSVLEFRDITELKNYELSLKSAIEARDEFLSIASHELKTPLTSLIMQTQLQKRMMSKDDSRAFSKERVSQLIEQFDRLFGRLNRLIEDMLDISRISSGRLNIQKEEFDIFQLTKEVVQRMTGEMIAAGCGRPEISGQSVNGHWDALRIEQVLLNLITNAIRYGKGKPIAIKVMQESEVVKIAVIDHGIGITPENQIKIFQRFERAVNASEISGLGLGLYISEQIIKAHGGKIWVESELGQGSTFYVELPLMDSVVGTV
jgi:PAS domain S-box-containing protein